MFEFLLVGTGVALFVLVLFALMPTALWGFTIFLTIAYIMWWMCRTFLRSNNGRR